VTSSSPLSPPVPGMTRQAGLAIPQLYCFHPGHTGCSALAQNGREGFTPICANYGISPMRSGEPAC
jgi:hypothetical protein